MNNKAIKKTVKEIKILAEDIDQKIDYIIEKLSEIFYKK